MVLWIFANCECFTLKIFLEYRHHPLTTQSMVPPCLVNNEQSIEMLHGMWTILPLFKQLLHIDRLDFSLPSHKPCSCSTITSIQHT